MKSKHKSVLWVPLTLAIIVIYSCNFPRFSANNEAESLHQTVQALSTPVGNLGAGQYCVSASGYEFTPPSGDSQRSSRRKCQCTFRDLHNPITCLSSTF